MENATEAVEEPVVMESVEEPVLEEAAPEAVKETGAIPHAVAYKWAPDSPEVI